MEILKQFLVKYEKSKDSDKLAILMKTTNGYYIRFIDVDGMGWSERFEKIADDKAQALII